MKPLPVTLGSVAACLVLSLALSRPAPPLPSVPANALQFDGDRALGLARQIAHNYPGRVTGGEGARVAAEFLRDSFQGLGLSADFDESSMWLAGKRVPVRNVVAHDPGQSEDIVLFLAHYDAQTTSEEGGADNASGTALLLELARVLRTRGHLRTFVYVATDAEEWGMIGAREFIRRFPSRDRVVGAVSMDYVGHGALAGVTVSLGGQGSGYAPLWLRRTVAGAIRAAGERDLLPNTFWEIVDRAVRVSFQDQGPLNHWGVPAVNLGIAVTDTTAERRMYHSPEDTVEGVLPESMAACGRAAEALALALDNAPLSREPTVYLALGDSRYVPGWATQIAASLLFLPLLFWLAARLEMASSWRQALPLLQGWLILSAGYAALVVGARWNVFPRYELYPATLKDPFLERIPWLALVSLIAGSLAALGLLWGRLPAALGKATEFWALAVLWLLSVVSLAVNHFAAVLYLAPPALIWPWAAGRPLSRRLLLVSLGAAPFLVLIAFYAKEIYVGLRMPFYLLLQAAYGTWAPPAVLIFLGMTVCAVALAFLPLLARSEHP